MKDSLIGFITLFIMVVVGANMYTQYQTNTKFKTEVMELKEKQRSTESIELQSIYQDSINAIVDEWLMTE